MISLFLLTERSISRTIFRRCTPLQQVLVDCCCCVQSSGRRRHQPTQQRFNFSTETTNSNDATKTTIKFLDLRGSGLSILERLCLEECLYQKDTSTNWIIVGSHDVTNHRYLRASSSTKPIHSPRKHQKPSVVSTVDDEFDDNDPNHNAAIILGIGGKPMDLLNIARVQQDAVLCLKRFSGGGTVVLDNDSIWTTIIGRPTAFSELKEIFPRPIMQWTVDTIFHPMFHKLHSKQQQQQYSNKQQRNDNNRMDDTVDTIQRKTMIMDTKSCAFENTGRVITIPIVPSASHDTTVKRTMPQGTEPPYFALRENDYVFVFEHPNGSTDSKKMGGNAQAIGKTGFLHHTSFLWKYDPHNMEYLTLPKKRPEYRTDRSHDDFLVEISAIYPTLTKRDFISTLYETCYDQFVIQRQSDKNSATTTDHSKHNTQVLFEQVTIHEAMKIIHSVTDGLGLQGWYEQKSRNKVLTEL